MMVVMVQITLWPMRKANRPEPGGSVPGERYFDRGPGGGWDTTLLPTRKDLEKEDFSLLPQLPPNEAGRGSKRPSASRQHIDLLNLRALFWSPAPANRLNSAPSTVCSFASQTRISEFSLGGAHRPAVIY